MKLFLFFLIPLMCFGNVFIISESNLNSRSSSMRNSDIALQLLHPNQFSDPSSISKRKGMVLSSTYSKYFKDIYLSNINLIIPLENNIPLFSNTATAFSVTMLNYGEFKDIMNDTYKTYNPYDIMVSGSFAKSFEKFRSGINIKYIYSNITDEYSSSALLTDISGSVDVYNDKIKAAGGIFNLGFQLNEYNTTYEKVNSYFKIGISNKLDRIPLSLCMQYDHYLYDDNRISAGAEFYPKENFILRAGYDFSKNDREIGTNEQSEKFAGLSFGASLIINYIDVDISYLINGGLDDEFGVSINLLLSEIIK